MNNLKPKFYIFTLISIIFGSCLQKPEINVEKPAAETPVLAKAENNTIKLHKLKKLFVVGDFDGDGAKDTIFQHNFSRLTRNEIENAADPYQNDWDTVITWFYSQQSDVYLVMNKNNRDTLHLGAAQGLYCLINIGDNNSDGKDEMAFVVDHLDFSNVNTCKIYTWCKGKWTELKQFGIHEDSFNYTDKVPVFHEIKDFLEKQNGKWTYLDYSKNDFENAEDVGKMQKLNLEKCN